MRRLSANDRLSLMEAEMVDPAIPGDCFDTLLLLQDDDADLMTVVGMQRDHPTIVSSAATSLQVGGAGAWVKMESRVGSVGTWVVAADGELCFRIEAASRQPAEGPVVVAVQPPPAMFAAAVKAPALAGERRR